MVLFCAAFSRGRTSEDSYENAQQKPRKFMKPCFNEDELLNLCTDPIEVCHEDRADEIKLVRLDGIKVGYLTYLTMNFHARQKPRYRLSPRAT